MAESSTILTYQSFETETDESDLVEAARKDLREFGVLYKRFVTPVFRYLYSRTGNVHEAEDITAQTFLIALETFERFRGDGHFSSWLFGIARNKVIDHYRQRKPVVPIEDAASEAENTDPLIAAIQSEQAAAAAKLIKTLDEDEQELLRLRFLAGMSFREIAHLLRRNEDAVKKTTYRLLARLQSQLEKSDE
ncbi:MAG: RNA polymerase sigma factor [Bellilinea sp.]